MTDMTDFTPIFLLYNTLKNRCKISHIGHIGG
jgi:hypothetical protein